MTRLDDIKAELTLVRTKISEAYSGSSISVDGHSLSRQSIESLKEREAELTWYLQESLQGGPFGAVVIRGKNDDKFYTRSGQQ